MLHCFSVQCLKVISFNIFAAYCSAVLNHDCVFVCYCWQTSEWKVMAPWVEFDCGIFFLSVCIFILCCPAVDDTTHPTLPLFFPQPPPPPPTHPHQAFCLLTSSVVVFSCHFSLFFLWLLFWVVVSTFQHLLGHITIKKKKNAFYYFFGESF